MDTERQLTLADGRRLAFAEFGAPDGHPVLYFHGAPSSRLEPLLIGDQVLREFGLRVIAPDRPGMGRSDPQPQRGFSAWPVDVVALADHLGLGRFAVLGNSGGGGYAAVCAARIPERLNAVVIVSGGWPMSLLRASDGLPALNRMVWLVTRRAPWLLRPLIAMMAAGAAGTPAQQLAQMESRVPAADLAAFAAPGRLAALNGLMREAVQQGTRGAAWDMSLYGREWDFRLDEIRMPLTLFHGELDANVPVALARRMSALLPAAVLKTYPDEAHLSVLTNRFAAIAATLVAAQGAALR